MNLCFENKSSRKVQTRTTYTMESKV